MRRAGVLAILVAPLIAVPAAAGAGAVPSSRYAVNAEFGTPPLPTTRYEGVRVDR